MMATITTTTKYNNYDKNKYDNNYSDNNIYDNNDSYNDSYNHNFNYDNFNCSYIDNYRDKLSS